MRILLDGTVSVSSSSRPNKHLCFHLQVLELDVMDVRIVEERSNTVTIETSPVSAHIQRKHFLNFTDERIFSVLMEICRTLGS